MALSIRQLTDRSRIGAITIRMADEVNGKTEVFDVVIDLKHFRHQTLRAMDNKTGKRGMGAGALTITHVNRRASMPERKDV